MADQSPAFPAEILAEILSRATLETVWTCRLVSKGVKKVIDQPSFAKLFLQNTGRVSGFFIQGKHSDFMKTFVLSANETLDHSLPQLSLDFLATAAKSPVRIIASTKSGLLLCDSVDGKRLEYYVCKPTTRQWRKIPNPSPTYRYMVKAIAMEVLQIIPLHYKIVAFSCPRKPKSSDRGCDHLRFEIFDSRTWRWKKLDDVIITVPYLSHQPAVSTAGKFYWKLREMNGVFGFNLEDESWEIFALPPLSDKNDVRFDKREMVLVDYRGSLGVVCMLLEEECLELWVKDDNGGSGESGGNAWSKVHRVCIAEIALGRRNAYGLLGLSNGDVAVLFDGVTQLVFYKFGDCSTFKVVLERPHYLSDLITFQSDGEMEEETPVPPKGDLPCATPNGLPFFSHLKIVIACHIFYALAI